MPTSVTATELARKLGDLLSRIRYRHESFIVERNGTPIAGRLTVVAGRKYRVPVADPAPWDYDILFLPCVLTTDIQSRVGACCQCSRSLRPDQSPYGIV